MKVSKIEVIPKIVAAAIVMRSRFLSIIVEPVNVSGIPPPKAEESPPPRPAWRRIVATKTMLTNK